jgi:hypothetical protein
VWGVGRVVWGSSLFFSSTLRVQGCQMDRPQACVHEVFAAFTDCIGVHCGCLARGGGGMGAILFPSARVSLQAKQLQLAHRRACIRLWIELL